MNSITATNQQIDYDKITPYVATLPRKLVSLDIARFKSFGGVGVVLEAGYLFDSSHNKLSNPRNPNIEAQINMIKNSDLALGLYWVARARTVEEADDEMKELSYLIYKYPLNLGMWLQLDLTRTISINDTIVEKYQRKLEDLGLKGKIGFYNSQDNLFKITWRKFCNSWLYWDSTHVEGLDADSIKQTITPALFRVEGDDNE